MVLVELLALYRIWRKQLAHHHQRFLAFANPMIKRIALLYSRKPVQPGFFPSNGFHVVVPLNQSNDQWMERCRNLARIGIQCMHKKAPKEQETWRHKLSPNGGFQKWGYPKMDGL